MAKVMARKTRTGNKTNLNLPTEISTKRQIKKSIERDGNSSNETDDEIRNIRKRT
jgi:hypothetical protein